MDTLKQLLESKEFDKAIKEAIESGKDYEYVWNGEDEVKTDTFDADIATYQVIKTIKEKLLGIE